MQANIQVKFTFSFHKVLKVGLCFTSSQCSTGIADTRSCVQLSDMQFVALSLKAMMFATDALFRAAARMKPVAPFASNDGKQVLNRIMNNSRFSAWITSFKVKWMPQDRPGLNCWCRGTSFPQPSSSGVASKCSSQWEWVHSGKVVLWKCQLFLNKKYNTSVILLPYHQVCVFFPELYPVEAVFQKIQIERAGRGHWPSPPFGVIRCVSLILKVKLRALWWPTGGWLQYRS